jgi:hypothetical protein
MTVNRYCSSGLQTIAMAAQRAIVGEGRIFVADGVESISCVQNQMNKHILIEGWLHANRPTSIGACCRLRRRSLSIIGSHASGRISSAPRVSAVLPLENSLARVPPSGREPASWIA